MLHRTAKLTPFGRRLLVERIALDGWPPATAAETVGVSRATAYKWLRRYRAEGLAGLDDRSSRPRRRPRALPDWSVRRIVVARRRLRVGPDRLGPLLGHPSSTVYGVLRRHGLSRLAHADRLTGAPVRYVRERPGELLHVDVKTLGRIPPGGGHRMLGPSARNHLGLGHDVVHVAIDDATRVAYVGVFDDEKAATTVRFIRDALAHFAALGVRVERVMTDNAWTYTHSAELSALFAERGIRHLTIRPRRPETNGKAERFIGTLQREWAYARLYRSNDERLEHLPRWLDFYNRRRPHAGLDGQTPIATLVNKVEEDDS
ncbi:MAG TPA: IS481 family transposase [Candidatus Limnocylindrales bacterium]|nr:IS481 family transposase [Candidatus Limnocylindrales bacterium]